MNDAADFPPLDFICPECDGKDYHLVNGENVWDCHTCHNRRRILTPFGKAMVEFMRRHVRWDPRGTVTVD